MYRIGEKLEVKRVGDGKLEFKLLGGKDRCVVSTQTLASLLIDEMPKDKAQKMLEAIDEQEIQRGKARVVVKAHKTIQKGEEVCFVIDITKYTKGGGVRTTKSGLIY